MIRFRKSCVDRLRVFPNMVEIPRSPDIRGGSLGPSLAQFHGVTFVSLSLPIASELAHSDFATDFSG